MARPAAQRRDPATGPRLSDRTLRGFLGYGIKRASNAIQADLARTLKPHGLRMVTYSALALIDDNPGLRQSELAQGLDVEQPNLVVIVDELEQRGLVSRDRDPADRRAYALHLTERGRSLLAQATQDVNRHEERLYSGLNDDDRQIVIQAMALIRGHEREED